MAYNAKSQKTYNDKCYRLTLKYIPSEESEYNRLKAYLNSTNQSANSYIKALVKADLDNKGMPYTKTE